MVSTIYKSKKQLIMQSTSNYFKRKFAEFLASYDEESYKVHASKKSKLFEKVKGEVLEIGPGTGVNFPFLKDKEISWLGIEPNPEMHSFLMEKASFYNIAPKLLDCTTESICLPDNSVDFVISTEVLCSVSDLKESLKEILMVLKPGVSARN